MVNKATLVGRLGKDPEIRETSAGKVAKFSLATDETYKDRDGERQKRTEWHNIVVWGKLADVCEQYIHKGDMIFVEGRIQSRAYESQQDNTTRTAYEIIASAIKILQSTGDGNSTKQKKATKPQISDEDIPF